MTATDRAHSLLQAGKEAEAVALIENAAADNDADALFTLADWRLYGLHGPQDFAGAHDCLKRAAGRGHIPSARVLAFLTASGTGCEADFEGAVKMIEEIAPHDPYSALQLEFLSHMAPPETGRRAERQTLSADPSIALVKGLFRPQECHYLLRFGEPHLRPALIIDPETGEGIPKPVRTAHAMSILATQEDLVVQMINRRLAEATGTRPDCAEPLNILRYAPGQEYRPHHDSHAEDGPDQRMKTALIYLNRDYEGGETQFPLLGVTGRGDVGDVLVFDNVLADGRRDDRTYHAGLPVRSGVKWLASRWIRRTPFVPQ